MSKLLDEAIRKASELPEDKQDHLGATLLAEMALDEQWESTLTSPESLAVLDEWASEALEDFRSGRTTELDPDSL